MTCGCKDSGPVGGWNLIHDNEPPIAATQPGPLPARAPHGGRWPWWAWVVLGLVVLAFLRRPS